MLTDLAIAKARAQETVEYGLMIATIAIVVLIGATLFGPAIRAWLADLLGSITRVGT